MQKFELKYPQVVFFGKLFNWSENSIPLFCIYWQGFAPFRLHSEHLLTFVFNNLLKSFTFAVSRLTLVESDS